MNSESILLRLPNSFDLPRRIEKLGILAYNLWWTWEKDAQEMFASIDHDLWERTYHNPVKFLRQVQRTRINAVSQDNHFLKTYDSIMERFDTYMVSEETWFHKTYPESLNEPIAYFSSEFGLHETLPIYAGGLGVLSGDHLKEASDLGLPLVAVGFLYTNGYFSQHITEDGWQEARYVELHFDELPVVPVIDQDEIPMTVSVNLSGREVFARVWVINVGRVPLYLLDSNVEENSESDQQLTARLYSSDLDLRISQEIILGVCGVRALRSLGYNPSVWHMNEGHSGFLALERARELVQGGTPFEEAMEKIRVNTIFTTHTPVPAGNDEFPLWLMDKYFSNFWESLGLDRDSFLNIARRQLSWGETFSMPVLALKMSWKSNGVSELHGQVARRMWQFLWPEKTENEIPITYITNGVHTGTWLARSMRNLYNEFLEENWLEEIDAPAIWEKFKDIPDEKLWAVHRHQKSRMVNYFRDRARHQWLFDGIHPVQVVAAGALLNPDALTIGFARRFATYKRANLILRDLDRILKIINDPHRPVQIIFAGKAHPADEPGKILIQDVYRKVKLAETGGRLVFVEDYDMNVARYLVQGVDVWLNTPRRPNEASGTSGEKAALNGALNFSVLDGWWREGYNGRNGWSIGTEKEYADSKLQDEDDANDIYETLENKIIPLYYENRTPDGVPTEWIEWMKESVRSLAPQFSMRRMLKEYTTDLYIPSMKK
ncbi:MAG: alpha-glucan family phosphorylase [Anaerolineales bacterium]|nr:alpha-glucan family phosphorylase [Anaerolineales bacterium]